MSQYVYDRLFLENPFSLTQRRFVWANQALRYTI